MKVTIFTPLPPAPTGIADYGSLLVNELRKRAPDLELRTVSSDAEVSQFRPPEGPHVLVYQVGNSPHHDFLYPALARHPGVLVLHDLVLHHARLFSYLESPEVSAYREDMGDRRKRDAARVRLAEYRREVVEACPDRGEVLAEIALRIGGGRLLYEYPLYEHLVRKSRLTLVHAERARAEILERCPEAAVKRIRMGVPIPKLLPREEARKRLGIPQDALVLASFGLVTPEKRISTALRALARLETAGLPALYYLVGGAVPHYDPSIEARELGIAGSVRLTGRVPEEELSLYAFASDLCLSLRYPSAGETSATLLRLLACGRPVVVTEQVQALDLPDSVVARSPLAGDEDGLYCDLLDLIRSERRRRELGQEARRYVEREASPKAMADDYLEVITECANGDL